MIVTFAIMLESKHPSSLYEEYNLFQNDVISFLEFLGFFLNTFVLLILFNLLLTYISIPLFKVFRKLSNYINKL